MIKEILKILTPLTAMMLAVPAAADWPVAVTDKFVVHPTPYTYNLTTYNTTATILDVLKNDVGDNLKVVAVNEWSENGAKIWLRPYFVDPSGVSNNQSRFMYHKFGNVSYTPKEGFVGTDGFWYVIEDDQGRKNAIKVEVEVRAANSTLPAAIEDFVEVPTGKSIRINALENDLFSDSFNSGGVTFRGDIVDFNTVSKQGGKVEKVEVSDVDSLSFGPLRYGGFSLSNTLKYQFKYTPPAGFVGVDSFTYAVKDPQNQYGREVTDTVSWTKVNINVVANSNFKTPWPVAYPDRADIVVPSTFSPYSYFEREIDVLKNDAGEGLLIKLVSDYSQNGRRVSIVPNYPSRPVIHYSASSLPGAPDKIWYIIEDQYGRRNFSYVDVHVTY